MKRTRAALLTAVLGAALLGGHIGAQVLPPAPPSLKTVPVPERDFVGQAAHRVHHYRQTAQAKGPSASNCRLLALGR